MTAGNSHKEAQCGSDQRLRNTAGDCSQTGCLLLGNVVETIQNSNDGAE